MTTTTASFEIFNHALPVVAVLLWLAIYVVYFWRDPDVRRWIERRIFHLASRGHRPDRLLAPHALAIFRPPPPASTRPVRQLRAATGGAAGSAALAIAPLRIAEWRVEQLPMRYRLLGQVRAAANDN